MRETEQSSDPRRVALVTGAAQGIGRGVADELAARGWIVHVTVHSASRLADSAARFGEAFVHQAELEDADAASAVVDRVLDREGRLDGLVHAVGPYATGPLSESTPQDFDAMLRGNLFTALHLIAAARAPLRRSAGSYLFFGCAGLERWRARRVTTAYISAKAALLVTMRGLALEEAPFGVRANMISPGFVPHGGAAPDTLSENLHAKIPIGRPAQIVEVAQTAAWLLSPEASHVVGQNLEVAGGWML